MSTSSNPRTIHRCMIPVKCLHFASPFAFYFSLFTFYLFISLLLAGCNKESPAEDPTAGGDIQFKIGFASTGADFNSTFESGDAIGVFAVRRASSAKSSLQVSGNYIHNAKLTYNGRSWIAAAPIFYPANGDVLDFYAYYPYNVAATNPTAITFSVQANQSSAAGYGASDLLTARATGIAKGTVVALQFVHRMALIEVVLTKNLPTTDPAGAAYITLIGCKPATTLNFGALSASEISAATGNTANIRMLRMEPDSLADTYTYRVLVPAQSMVAGTKMLLISKFNELYDYNTPTQVNLTAGTTSRHSVGIPFIPIVKIPAGTFIMGSPADEPNRGYDETAHEVTLTRDFWMGRYEVTNAQYTAFLNTKGIGAYGVYAGRELISGGNKWGLRWNVDKWESFPGCAGRPVICVSWYGAYEFARWVGGRLPTEAEWEYACRAGNIGPFGLGDGSKLNYTMANFFWGYPYTLPGGEYYDRAHSYYPRATQLVGSYAPNAWGLYDMHGNVWEWCNDWYGAYPSGPVVDPTGPASGYYRILRGGSWEDGAESCRSARRMFYDVPYYGSSSAGFRVVFVP